MAEKKKLRILLALGGNALCKPGQKGTTEEQMKVVEEACKDIVELLRRGDEVVITHGNGPQVGADLIQQELGKSRVPARPLRVLVSETQGMIGYMIQSTLRNALSRAGLKKEVVSIVTEVEVDGNDPGFLNPTKPVGPFYSKEEAEKIMATEGKILKEDAGRGWRVVVASPAPIRTLQSQSIDLLLKSGAVVIAAGGGGIPVLFNSETNQTKGVDAVIDKDLTGEVLAKELKVDRFLILTDVSFAYLHYRDPEKKKEIGSVALSEMKRYVEEEHFAAGSMLPKVKAAMQFTKETSNPSAITSVEHAVAAVYDGFGTSILPDST